MTTPGHLGRPPDHSQISGRAYRPLTNLQEGLPATPGPVRGPPNHSQIFVMA